MTGAGAVVGAIAGGGKGAAIGAGAGAAAGVGTNMATRGKAAVIPAETLMEFRLSAPSTVVLPTVAASALRDGSRRAGLKPLPHMLWVAKQG